MNVIMNKPELWSDSRILNIGSGFRHKMLCTGPTFTAGSACVYDCAYCYVEDMVGAKPFVTNVLQGRCFQSVVIRRRDAVGKLRQELRSRGRLKFKASTGVIFGSPLVDIAPTLALTQETIEIVKVLLSDTGWEVRLLSKSPLIVKIAEALTAEEKKRVIFGLSTGTFDDATARAIEPSCPSPSRRVDALRWLQDHGFRTYGMLCPILPQAAGEHRAYAELAFSKVRPDRCEHVWAEVLNERSGSTQKTVAALELAGLNAAAVALAAVSGKANGAAWEQYARDTFLALAAAMPRNAAGPKLRFLQYESRATERWWRKQIPDGAVLLSKVQTQPEATGNPIKGNCNNQAEMFIAAPPKDPKRVAAAHKAWDTIRARVAGK
jgi:DNA repair photolyase